MKKRMVIGMGSDRILLLIGGALLAAQMAVAGVYDVVAKGDAVTDCTADIQRQIDACSAAGGGMVRVPAGTYLTYTLNLKSNVELHLDPGCTLLGGTDPLKYPLFPHSDLWRAERAQRWNRRAMFYTVGQTNVSVTGSGTIDGNAPAFHHQDGKGRWVRNSDTNITGRCLFFAACRDVKVDGVRIRNPAGWSTWFLDCDRVGIHALRIETHRLLPNGDGIHLGGCRDVTVSDCNIDSQDDAIVLRSHQEQMNEPRPLERVTIANCIIRSNRACAVRIAWTEDAPVKDCLLSNILCPFAQLGVVVELPTLPEGPDALWRDPPRGNGVPPPDRPNVPFALENLSFDHLVLTTDTYPLWISVGKNQRVDYMRNVRFANCQFTSKLPPAFDYKPEHHVSDWRFSNCEFTITEPVGKGSCWFPHADGIVLDNVRWSAK